MMAPFDSASAPVRALSHATLQQAAEWFALLRSEGATPAEHSGWRAWLNASADHQAAWQRVEALGRQFDLPESERAAVAAALNQGAAAASRQQRRRSAIKTLALLASTGLGVWGASRTSTGKALLANWGADHTAPTGHSRELLLADGGRALLASGSALDVAYTPRLRRLHLRRGELLVTTAADTQQPARPFVVDTPAGRVRAIGTRFNLRQQDDSTLVSVFDGAVEISPGFTDIEDNNESPRPLPRVLQAGSQLRFTPTGFDAEQPADPARLAWSRGVLLADNLPLGQVVAELAPYFKGHLACHPSVAHLRVVGGYPLTNPPQALAMLAAALPVRLDATLPWWVTVAPRS